MSDPIFPVANEKEFQKFLVREYLKYGSVDAVYEVHQYAIPISYAQYQRVLDKWGIVKAAGPNSKLSEVVNFLADMVEHNIPLDKLYKKMPSSFLTSAVTLYRILSYIKEGITRRLGTGLIISPEGDTQKVLVAQDYSTPRADLGKSFGSLTIPMGFSKKTDSRESSILRILQGEVFSDLVVEKTDPDIIPDRPKPFLYLDIADVRVEVFHIVLPKDFCNLNKFSSYKLKNYRFLKIEDDYIKDGLIFRSGVKEALKGYTQYLQLINRNVEFNPIIIKSEMNYFFASE